MTEERIVELRALCAEYKKKLAACEAAGLKDKAADIAADGVGRKGWLAYPVQREKVQRGHNAVVLDTEIRAVIEDGQFLLARA